MYAAAILVAVAQFAAAALLSDTGANAPAAAVRCCWLSYLLLLLLHPFLTCLLLLSFLG